MWLNEKPTEKQSDTSQFFQATKLHAILANSFIIKTLAQQMESSFASYFVLVSVKQKMLLCLPACLPVNLLVNTGTLTPRT